MGREEASRKLDRYELAKAAEQRFESLSGGQQARLQILLLELSGATLLLLDEPTDNLDLESAEALEQGLDSFEGTVIAVTHDRWFARGFDRFLIFGADGSVYESSRAGLGRGAGRTLAVASGDARPANLPRCAISAQRSPTSDVACPTIQSRLSVSGLIGVLATGAGRRRRSQGHEVQRHLEISYHVCANVDHEFRCLHGMPGSAQIQPHQHTRKPAGDRAGVRSLDEAGVFEELAGAHVGHGEIDLLAAIVYGVALDRRRTLRPRVRHSALEQGMRDALAAVAGADPNAPHRPDRLIIDVRDLGRSRKRQF